MTINLKHTDIGYLIDTVNIILWLLMCWRSKLSDTFTGPTQCNHVVHYSAWEAGLFFFVSTSYFKANLWIPQTLSMLHRGCRYCMISIFNNVCGFLCITSVWSISHFPIYKYINPFPSLYQTPNTHSFTLKTVKWTSLNLYFSTGTMRFFLLKDCSAAAHASSLVYVSVVKSLVPIYCHCSFELFN